jgi:hypothetical protein
MPSTYLG